MDARDETQLLDLLDGRLEASEAETLRRRIDSEAELKEAWEDLLRIRDTLRADAGPRLPDGFLASVKARIAVEAEGGAPETDGAPSQEAVTPAAPAVPGAAPPPTLGRLLRILPVAYAAAAVLVVGLGVAWVMQAGDPAVEVLDQAAVETSRDERAENLRRVEPMDHMPEVALHVPAEGGAVGGRAGEAWEERSRAGLPVPESGASDGAAAGGAGASPGAPGTSAASAPRPAAEPPASPPAPVAPPAREIG
ncbi:MAG: hypothetical protein ACYTG6_16745, partial [Planctomycetota bacterium]